MGRRLRRCQKKGHRVRLLTESVKSSPACQQADRSQSSCPCSQARWPRLPDWFFQVCASALVSPSRAIAVEIPGWVAASSDNAANSVGNEELSLACL